MKDSYLTIKQQSVTEIKIKASKFIATLFPVDSSTDAECELKNIKKKYSNASHNCYAYHLDSEFYRYSDDGEPSGTAGKIIFEQIKRYHLEKVMLIVTRYFGGTKLGTGGLIRAYSEAATNVILKSKIVIYTNRTCLKLKHKYEQTNTIMHLLNQYDTIIIETIYGDCVILQIDIKCSETKIFIQDIFDATNGSVIAKVI